MKTPNAVIGVIGTDFYVGFESNTTTVICYKGKVSVTPTNGAHAANNSGQSDAASNSVTVSAGPNGGNHFGDAAFRVSGHEHAASNVAGQPHRHGHTDERRNPASGPHASLGYYWHRSGGGTRCRTWRRPDARRWHDTATRRNRSLREAELRTPSFQKASRICA